MKMGHCRAWRVQNLFSVFLLTAMVGLSPEPTHAHKDAFMHVLEAAPPLMLFGSLMRESARNFGCRDVFSPAPGVVLRVQGISSYSLDNGKRNDLARGYMLREEGMEKIQEHAKPIMDRILSDWLATGYYTPTQIEAIARLHNSLNPSRLKLIYIESADSSLFSALRVYDSSPVVRDLGRPWTPAGPATDTIELTERVFPNFDLSKAMAEAGMKRANQTWSLGLFDVAGRQQKALFTLLAQAADNLDLHYNNREYFNFESLSSIKANDVDLVFYSNEPLMNYYSQLLQVEPLRTKSGEYLRLRPRSTSGAPGDFFVFVIKGSEFIPRFFRMELQEPMYSASRALRDNQQMHQMLKAKILPHYRRLNLSDYSANNFAEFSARVRTILAPFAELAARGRKPTEDQIWYGIAQSFALRRAMNPKLFSQEVSPSEVEQLSAQLRFLVGQGPMATLATSTTLSYLTFYLRDPMLFLINRIAPKPAPNLGQ